MAEPPRHVRLSLFVREPQRRREVLDRLSVLALALIQEAAIIKSLGIFRLQPDGFVEILKRLVVTALLAVNNAAADIGGRVRGVDRQRLVLIGKRLIEFVEPS